MKTSRLLDRETMARYSLRAYAEDESVQGWECLSHIQISLTDVNDNAPDFQQTLHRVSLSEDSAVGTFLTKMTAVDHDRGIHDDAHSTYRVCLVPEY